LIQDFLPAIVSFMAGFVDETADVKPAK